MSRRPLDFYLLVPELNGEILEKFPLERQKKQIKGV